jgi:hypothetical protein
MSGPGTVTSEPASTLAFVWDPLTPAVMSLVIEAREICDVLWIVDRSRPEVEPMMRFLRKFGTCLDVTGLTLDEAASQIAQYQPQGILSLADGSLLWTAQVAQRLGLKFMSPETAVRLTDKHAQREAFRDHGLAVPGNWIVPGDDDDALWRRLCDEATFPAVLKPRTGAASRDTVPVGSLEELREIWELHKSARDVPHDFVLEQYIADSPLPLGGEGFAGYVSVESFVCDGQVSHVGVNGRMPPAPPFRETGFFIPAALDPGLEAAVLDVARRAVTAMDIAVGCQHTEIKLTPDGPVVIEVNGRIGGGVPELLAAANGVRFMSLAVRLALGQHISYEELPPCDRVAYLLYVHAPQEIHTVTAVEGLSQLKETAGVDEIVLKRGPGQPVDWREGNHGYVYSVFGTVADHEELRHLYGLVSSLVTIEGE